MFTTNITSSASRRGLEISVLLLVLILHAAVIDAQIPDGPQFQVNTYTTGGQIDPVIDAMADGSFLVIWGGGNTVPLKGQWFDTEGQPSGSELEDLSGGGSPRWPDIAVWPNGSFVMVWASQDSDGSDQDTFSIQARLFDAASNPQGPRFQVNTYTPSVQWRPVVETDSGGGFVVAWESDGSPESDTEFFSVLARRFLADGTPLGDDFQVNLHTSRTQQDPEVAMNADGAFVVVWESDTQPPSGDFFGVWLQRFDNAGARIGGETLVPTTTLGGQSSPAIAMRPQGDFVVVWESSESQGDDTDLNSIQGQRFDSAWQPLGSEFQVNTYTTGGQYEAAAGLLPSGDFVVSWEAQASSGYPQDFDNVHARLLRADGPSAPDFLVNTYTPDFQCNPAVTGPSDQRFVVVWQSEGSVGNDEDISIQGQLYLTAIFGDGFESGDLSAWSAVVP